MGAESSSQNRNTRGTTASHLSRAFSEPVRPQSSKPLSPSTSSPSGDQRRKSKESAGEIITVNKTADTSEERFVFTLPFKPLIPVGYEALSSSYIQLQPQPLIDLGLILEEYLRSRAESVSRNQARIVEIIREVESSSASLENHLWEKERRINKVVSSLGKLSEIEKLFEKYEASLESCLTKIDLLNNSLPQHLKLEELPTKPSS